MTDFAESSNDPAFGTSGNPAPSSWSLTREPPWAAEIGALFLATAQRLATDETYRLAIQKMLV